MPVTKETYTANAPWTSADMADMLRDAFIDAGLMTAWHDSFSFAPSFPNSLVRVLEAEYDGTKTYGTSFYSFYFQSSSCALYLASGWNASGTPPVNVPTGTRYLDYTYLPSSYSAAGSGFNAQVFVGSSTSNLFLDRYTSQDDSKQSWFVWRQSAAISRPFSILHPDTVLHSWLNLDQGMISGFQRVRTRVASRVGYTSFDIESNLRRCLLTGTALRGNADSNPGFGWNDIQYPAYLYAGLGSQSNAYGSNFPFDDATILPVGRSSANPAFTSDYIPICTELPWSMWSPTLLANDFGVYMHYADNNVGYGDRFIVQSALNEWQVLNFANNANVNDGASPTFLARII